MAPADIVSIITALTTLVTTIAVLLRQTNTHTIVNRVNTKVDANSKQIEAVHKDINGRVDELVAASYKSGADDANKPQVAAEGT